MVGKRHQASFWVVRWPTSLEGGRDMSLIVTFFIYCSSLHTLFSIFCVAVRGACSLVFSYSVTFSIFLGCNHCSVCHLNYQNILQHGKQFADLQKQT